MKKTVLSLTLALLLVACASTPTAIMPPPDKKVILDPRIYELCEPLNSLSKNSTFDDVLDVVAKNFELYADCARRQEVSSKLLKEFSNVKEK